MSEETVTMSKSDLDALMARVSTVEARVQSADTAPTIKHCNVCGKTPADPNATKCPDHPFDFLNTVRASSDRERSEGHGKLFLVRQT